MPKRPVEKTFVKTRIKKNDQVKVIAGRDIETRLRQRRAHNSGEALRP